MGIDDIIDKSTKMNPREKLVTKHLSEKEKVLIAIRQCKQEILKELWDSVKRWLKW